MGDRYAPTWTIDGFQFSGMAPYHRNPEGEEYDENGWASIVEKETGWVSGAPPRTNRVARAGTAPGSYRGPASRDERIITLEGRTWTRTRADRERAELALAGMCADPAELYEMRRFSDVMDQTLYVELDDAPSVELVNSHTIIWSYQFAAPNPIKFDSTWQQPITNLPTQGTGGLDFSDVGLEIDPLYLDFGEPPGTGLGMIGNTGTADSSPLFCIRGPVVNPGVFEVATGTALRYTGTVGPSDVLWMNAALDPQRSIPGHGVYLNNANRRTSLALQGDWPVVKPKRTATYQFFAADYNEFATLQVWFRSAWL